MSEDKLSNGWNEWRQHVLRELERQDHNLEVLREKQEGWSEKTAKERAEIRAEAAKERAALKAELESLKTRVILMSSGITLFLSVLFSILTKVLFKG